MTLIFFKVTTSHKFYAKYDDLPGRVNGLYVTIFKNLVENAQMKLTRPSLYFKVTRDFQMLKFHVMLVYTMSGHGKQSPVKDTNEITNNANTTICPFKFFEVGGGHKLSEPANLLWKERVPHPLLRFFR